MLIVRYIIIYNIVQDCATRSDRLRTAFRQSLDAVLVPVPCFRRNTNGGHEQIHGWIAAKLSAARLQSGHQADIVQPADGGGAEAKHFRQHLIGMLAQERRP